MAEVPPYTLASPRHHARPEGPVNAYLAWVPGHVPGMKMTTAEVERYEAYSSQPSAIVMASEVELSFHPFFLTLRLLLVC